MTTVWAPAGAMRDAAAGRCGADGLRVGAHDGCGEEAFGMVDRQMLCDHPAQREAPGVGPFDAVGVEDADGVFSKVRGRVRRRVRGVAGRGSGVAVVIADDIQT
jgi:hypothetical protein